MKRAFRLVTVVVAVCFIVTTGGRAESVPVLLEKALYEEKTGGNIDGAIVIYSQIISDANANRRHVAMAQYRLAFCHYKKADKAKAREAFEALISRYPEQAKLVASAKKNIAKLVPAGDVPRVLSMTPAHMATDVDPGLKEITVTFDRPMKTDRFSWTGDKGEFPNTQGESSYDETGMTCTLRVNLSPGRSYWVGINSDSHKNFQAADGTPASRHVILFSTKDSQGKPTPIASALQRKRESVSLGAAPVVTSEQKLESERLSAEGWKAWGQQNFAQAEMSFEQAVAKDPGNVNAWNGLGWARFNQVMPMNAEEAFKKCLALDPRHPAGLNGMGWIERGRGHNNEAIEYWERAVQASPHATAPLSGLVQTYTELGNHDMAVNYYQKWLDVDPTNADVRKGLEAAKAKGGVYASPTAEASKDVEPIALQPSPWQDGETMRLSLKSPAGMELGTVIWEAKATEAGGKPAWQISQRMVVTVNNTFQHTVVQALEKDFAPYRGYTKNQLGTFNANYGDGSVDLAVRAGGTETRRDISTHGTVYDNEQALYVIRRLPLKVGYSAAFPIFPVQGGVVVDCRIEVTGRETVSVGAGSFDCYKVELAVYSGAVKAMAHALWFSADRKQVLVKYDSGQAVMALEAYTTAVSGARAEFANKEAGVALSAPAGWAFYEHASPGNYRLAVQLLPPSLQAWSTFIVTQRGPDTTSARFVADADIEVLKGYFKNYVVRESSRMERRATGLEYAFFAADYEDPSGDMVEYRTYILGKSTVYWFVFRMPKDQFEKMRPQFDRIVASFRVI